MSLRVLLLSDAIIFFFLSPFSFSNVFLFFIPGAFSQSRLLVVLRPDSRNRFLFFACLPFAFLFFCPPYKQMYIVLCYCCCYSTSRCFSYTDIYRAYNIRMLNYAFSLIRMAIASCLSQFSLASVPNSYESNAGYRRFNLIRFK